MNQRGIREINRNIGRRYLLSAFEQSKRWIYGVSALAAKMSSLLGFHAQSLTYLLEMLCEHLV